MMALNLSALSGHVDIFEFLSNGVNALVKNDRIYNEIVKSKRLVRELAKHEDAFNLFLRKVDPNLEFDDGTTILMLCITLGKGTDIIVERGANISTYDRYGKSPLHLSVDYDSTHFLLEQDGVKIDEPDDDGVTPIHYAVKTAKGKSVLSLLKAKANLNIRAMDGNSPLTTAINQGYHADDISLLLKSGANPNLRNQVTNTTPLNLAIGNNRPDLVELLLKHKAKLEQNSLHLAAYHRSPGCIKLFLELGMLPIYNIKGYTPLNELARYNKNNNVKDQLECAKLLNEAGLYFTKRSEYEEAKANGYTELIEYLLC